MPGLNQQCRFKYGLFSYHDPCPCAKREGLRQRQTSVCVRVGRHLRQRNLKAALIEEVVGFDVLGRDRHDKRKILRNPILEISHGAHKRRSPQCRLAAFCAAVCA